MPADSNKSVRLAKVIKEHLERRFKSTDGASIPDLRIDRYVLIILYEDHRRDEAFGRSHDVQKLEDLLHKINNAIVVAEALSESTRFHLDAGIRSILSFEAREQVPNKDFLADLRRLREVVERLRKEFPWATHKASKKANDHSATVAAACRRVWGEESIWHDENWNGGIPTLEISPHRYSDDRNYSDTEASRRRLFRDKVDKAAPRHVHSDALPDFGLFVESVFEALEIKGKTGEPPRPASALDRLTSINQENSKN